MRSSSNGPARFLSLLLPALLWTACATTDHAKSGSNEKVKAAPASEPELVPGPAFAHLTDLSGEKTSLAEHRKRVSVLAFWSAFCEPCIEEMPLVEALYQKYKDDPEVAILSVAVPTSHAHGERVKLAGIVQDKGLTAPVMLDVEHELITHFTRLMLSQQGRPPVDDDSFSLPLTAVIDGKFRAYLFAGLEEGLRPEQYVDKLSSLIALGQAGRLPESPGRPSAAPASGRPEKIKVKIPEALSVEERLQRLPGLRKILARSFAHLTPAQLDALIGQAEQQLRTGSVIELDIPPKSAP